MQHPAPGKPQNLHLMVRINFLRITFKTLLNAVLGVALKITAMSAIRGFSKNMLKVVPTNSSSLMMPKGDSPVLRKSRIFFISLF